MKPRLANGGDAVQGLAVSSVIVGIFLFGLVSPPDAAAAGRESQPAFRRIATFPVIRNLVATDAEMAEAPTVAEIIAATSDGQTVVYADSINHAIGFVDLAEPNRPRPAGVTRLQGEPTSVDVAGGFVVACVNTSRDRRHPSGHLAVIGLESRVVEHRIELAGQPDSVDVSPDGRFIAIAIENERDYSVQNGQPSQAPGGWLAVVDIHGPPREWSLRRIELGGLGRFPDDPEPEFVSINSRNECAITLQENNHIAVLDLRPASERAAADVRGNVVAEFTAGTTSLNRVDTQNDGRIQLTGSLANVAREPDGITWVNGEFLATANEGDLTLGSRGFSIFDRHGRLVFDSGNSLDHLAVRLGHYPESRSGLNGNEPEGVVYGRYGNADILFVSSERGNLVGVYDCSSARPVFRQALPTGVGPEGLLPVPSRNLFIVASEVDERSRGVRASITIYELQNGTPDYPTVISADRADGSPIPWSSLSALAADPTRSDLLYTLCDGHLRDARILEIDLSCDVPTIVREIPIRAPGESKGIPNLNAEGLCVRSDESFWVASCAGDTAGGKQETAGTSTNVLYAVSSDGAVLATVDLPPALRTGDVPWGLRGVCRTGTAGKNEVVFVCFHREWSDDPRGMAKIGRYDVDSDSWTFARYPLDSPTSPMEGWVGLAEMTRSGPEQFLILERDNHSGDDARVKRVYEIDIHDTRFAPLGDPIPVLSKKPVRDLLPDLRNTRGALLGHVSGLAILPNGEAYLVNDNQGGVWANGETQLINLGPIK